jgi:membrane protease YdiL (CAAX protease family)
MQDRDVTTPAPTLAPNPALDARRPGRLDAWLKLSDWHPRALPYLAYVGLLTAVVQLRAWEPLTYPLAYAAQCAITLWLLYKARPLLPELTLSFHWLSLPVGLAVAAGWIALGWALAGEWDHRWSLLLQGRVTGDLPFEQLGLSRTPWSRDPSAPPADFRHAAQMGLVVGWVALTLRLVGMSIVVPLCEELFMRSLLLRGLGDRRRLKTGLLQLAQDLPGVGDFILHRPAARRAAAEPPAFEASFQALPLGFVTACGFTCSTLAFMLMHSTRDWPGCLLCSAAYCALLAFTRRQGLGPVIWAHGVTNACLWLYSVGTGDWQFM